MIVEFESRLVQFNSVIWLIRHFDIPTSATYITLSTYYSLPNPSRSIRMTTLNPSHNIFREPEGRHAQAVRQADAASGSGSDVDGVDGDLDSRPQGVKRAKRHGRKRVKAAMPPIPDMRFEQVSAFIGSGIWVMWDIGSKPGG